MSRTKYDGTITTLNDALLHMYNGDGVIAFNVKSSTYRMDTVEFSFLIRGDLVRTMLDRGMLHKLDSRTFDLSAVGEAAADKL